MGSYDCGYLYNYSLNGVDDNNSPYEPPHSVPIPSVSSGHRCRNDFEVGGAEPW